MLVKEEDVVDDHHGDGLTDAAGEGAEDVAVVARRFWLAMLRSYFGIRQISSCRGGLRTDTYKTK